MGGMGGRYWSRRQNRSAGVFQPPEAPGPNSLPASADFADSQARTAFWMIGDTLFRSSGARVLRDARTDLGITAGDQAWTEGMLSAIRDRARTRGVSAPAMPASGAQLSREWLRLVLWVVYSDGSQPLSAVKLPAALRVPNVNQVLPGGEELGTVATSGFNPTLLAENPFTERVSFDVTGNVVRSSQGTRDNNTAMLVGGGLLLALLLGGDS